MVPCVIVTSLATSPPLTLDEPAYGILVASLGVTPEVLVPFYVHVVVKWHGYGQKVKQKHTKHSKEQTNQVKTMGNTNKTSELFEA